MGADVILANAPKIFLVLPFSSTHVILHLPLLQPILFYFKPYITPVYYSPTHTLKMDYFSSICPQCCANTGRLCDAVLPNMFPWAISFGCVNCPCTWFVCKREGCLIPTHKNRFYTRRQRRDHARHWHVRSGTSSVPVDTGQASEDEGFAFNDLFNHEEEDMSKDSQPPSLPVPSNTTPRIFDDPRTAQFADWCIEATVTDATTCLVAQALLQSPVSLGIDSVRQINSAAIHLFLCISQLVINTGAQQHRILCTILSMLIDLLPPGVAPWPPMPCSLSSFQSHILNPTNQHSLVSLLPGPKVSMMPDGYHAYCPLEEISAFVLLLPRTIGARAIPLRLKQLCQSRAVTKFMETVDNTNTECLVSIGLLFWLDGWDPSASTKNNRTPVHTASATFLLMDNATGKLFDCRTYPIACGPGKVDHNAVFAAGRRKSLNEGEHKRSQTLMAKG
mgnify:CR=1 FL=1